MFIPLIPFIWYWCFRGGSSGSEYKSLADSGSWSSAYKQWLPNADEHADMFGRSLDMDLKNVPVRGDRNISKDWEEMSPFKLDVLNSSPRE
jgi:hypothetical protein